MSAEGSLWISHPDLAEVARDVLSHGKGFRFRAHGLSMLPFIHPGDLLVVQLLEGKAPRAGEVILYQVAGERLAAHRVVRGTGAASGSAMLSSPQPRLCSRFPKDGLLRVRGDRLRAPLELVHPAQVLGRVVAIERDGRVLQFTRARHRLAALVWIALRPLASAARSKLGKIKRHVARVSVG